MKQNFKRVLAGISAVAMVLSTSSFLPYNNFNLVGEITASAEGTEQQETDVASVIIDGVESYYTTLEEAFAAANGKTATITMLKDAECTITSGSSPLMVSSGSVTLDMNEKTLTGYGVGYSGIIDVSGGSLYVQGNGRVDVKVIGFSCHGGNLVIANTTFSAIGNGANCAMMAVYNNGNITINSGSISGYYNNGQIYHYGGNTIINNIEMTEPSNKSCKGVYYYSTGKLEINGGTFGNITNRKGGVANLLGDGYTYKHQDGTWATDVELAGNSISNITIKKTPLKIEPQGDTAWYYNSGEHSLQINAAPLTDVKTISYEWYNGEIKLDCTADTYPIPKALTVGKYTYTCKATCDGYTLSHDFEFEVETCPHTGLDYKPLENNKHGGYCTICSNNVSEEHTWKDGVCSVCQTKAVAAMETGGVTTYYSTVEEAFTAAKGKTVTITLLNDVTASSILYVNSGDNITFYGGNYTLTGTPGEMAINVSGGELTITGGTIKAVSGEYKRSDGSVYVDSGKLVVTGGTLQGADDVTNGIGLLVSGGTVDLSGGKFIGGTSGYCGGIYSSSLFLSKLLQNYSSTTEPHYAYFDIDGRPIADVQNKKELAGTFIVAECKHDDSVYTYQPIDNTNTHHKTCRACGYSETAENCTYGNEYQHDNTNHWQTCEVCDGKNIEAHNIIAVNKKESTCTENGNSEYWKCNDCGICFSDSEGKIEIDLSDTVLSKISHSFTNYVSNNDATCIKNGTKTAKCDNCDATDTIEDEESLKTGHSLSYVSASSASCNYSGNRAYWYCTVCGKYFSDSAGTSETTWSAIKISATGHRFTNYISNGDATCTEDGTKTAECNYCYATNTIKDVGSATGHNYSDGKCTHCGAALSEYGAVVKEVSATLDGNIGMNYYIDLPQSVTDDNGAYAQFTVNGKTTKIMVNSIAPETDGTYKFTYRMNAKEMHDKVTFAVYDGNDDLADLYNKTGNKIDGSSFEYTLAEYFDVLASDTSEGNAALADLSKTALAYGSFAQKAFGYDVDTADIGIDISDVTVDTLENHKMTKTGEMPEGLRLSEMTLILESETTLCLYFKADDMSKYSFVLDNNTVTPAEISEENLYCIKIKNIAAKELDTQHKLVINDDCTITFDALSYAYSVVKAGKNDSVCDAVKALFKYNQAANKYFNELV